MMTYFLISSLTIISSIVVISARNPIHSVLALISVVLNLVVFLIFLEAEFLALTFVAVYLGAVSVLFLFIVMMLNLKSTQFSKEIIHTFPIGSFIGLVFIGFLYLIMSSNAEINKFSGYFIESNSTEDWFSVTENINNIDVFGNLLYTYYAPLLLIIGVILLIAMIGGVILTKTHYVEKEKKRNFIDQQVSRNYEHAVFLVNDKKTKSN